MDRSILQPRRIGAIAPFGEPLRHADVADELPASLAILLLQRQSLVIDKPACAGELAHLARLLDGRHKLEFEGLESFYSRDYNLVYDY